VWALTPAFADEQDVREMRDEIRSELTDRGPAAAGEVIVKYKGDSTFHVEKLSPGQTIAEGRRAFENRTDVEYVEPNYIAEAFMTPNDQYFGYQWNFQKINVPSAWDTSTGSGVIVAVVDSGVAYENFSLSNKNYTRAPDFVSTAFAPGYDFVNNDTHPNDDNGHGTHVTGTIAGSTNNTEGVAGIAYGATIMPIKVLSSNGSGTYDAVANGIRYAADHGAKVINLSLGGPSAQTLQDAVKYAYDNGVTIVAASGNSGASSVAYPAAYDQYVIAVGATRFDNARASYSQYGSALDLVAPGGDMNVDQNGDGYGDGILQQTFAAPNYGTFGYYFQQGTSMATPHVSGVAALVIAHGNATKPTDVRTAIESTALDLGTAGRDNSFGYGLVNAAAAVAWGTPPVDPPVEPPIEDPVEDPPVVPPTEITAFSDSFEVAEWNGLWTEDFQNDWYRSNQRATDGTNSAEVDGLASNAALTSISVNLQGKTNAKISFSWLIESSLDGGEYVTFETSTDGVNWVERARIRGNVDTENAWHSAETTLNNITNLRLRFRGKMSGSEEDANVDAVKVVAW
jgi:serine protease